MIKAIGDKSFLAPVDMTKINRVLDLGTGTGICGYPFPDLFGVFVDKHEGKQGASLWVMSIPISRYLGT